MPPRPHLTPEAKAALRNTIRGFRATVTAAIHDEAERTYRLGVARIDDARLDEAARLRRLRLEAWVDEQVRTVAPAKGKTEAEARVRFRHEAELEAAHTLVNRLIVLRHLEATGLVKPKVLTGGWKSPGYTDFRYFAPELCRDESEGYATLLQVVFDELALELPGVFGDVGLTALLPVPAATLRRVVEALDDAELEPAWTDDTTLGWVYQFWNDPRREELDQKIAKGGKIEPHEIASKTQMFTERYMVEWLLENSLGAGWLAICAKNGWTAEVMREGADGLSTLDRLEARRKDWRGRRERGEVALDALMPLETPLEDRWKYWVPRELPDDAKGYAPESIREFRIFDPACGSGHFLVIAFDLLVELYREEARHRGQHWDDREIAEGILERNLHGLDIDPRAVQIAAAALYLKAKALAPDAQPRALQLVASNLRIADLPADDPAVLELEAQVEREAELPRQVVQQVLKALHGADHLGSLLKVDAAIEAALRGHEERVIPKVRATQQNLFGPQPVVQAEMDFERKKVSVHEALERFLAGHGAAGDLGLRLRGEQLAAGVRFVRMVREGTYDLVVANPPYQGTSRMAEAGYIADHYRHGKADLYAAFLERGPQLTRDGGTSAMVTMRGWMFVGQYEELRKSLLHERDLLLLADLGPGAFEDISAAQVVVSVSLCLVSASTHPGGTRPAMRLTPEQNSVSAGTANRKRAGLQLAVGRHDFNPSAFRHVEGEPVLYWWTAADWDDYRSRGTVGDRSPARKGLCTGDDLRFVRDPWEVPVQDSPHAKWVPSIMGAEDRAWIEPLTSALLWHRLGLENKVMHEHVYGSPSKRVQSESLYFLSGIAFSMIGAAFSARVHRYRSVFGNMGSSVFPVNDVSGWLCMMNSTKAKQIMQSLNPGVHFEVGDVNRLPLFPIENADDIYATIEHAFTLHESHRETSVEFLAPGPSPWRHAQAWAQLAVDRPAGTPLPAYLPEEDPPHERDHISFAIGVALGRFGLASEGLLDASGRPCGIRPPNSPLPPPDPTPVPNRRLPHGLLYLTATGLTDSLSDPACKPLLAAWAAHGPAVAPGMDLNPWLRKRFFEDDHRKRYENRPIHLPLSSRDGSFVAWVNIHRWQDDTLRVLLADHLLPEKRALDGLLADLLEARGSTDKATRTNAERRYAQALAWRAELEEFIGRVQDVAERGAPQPDAQTAARQKDAPFVMDLDDGVMVNAGALWPLLEAQWKEPKKWWKQLAGGEFLWAHLCRRYWPERVEAKCREEPSHAVAHGCFWRLHPARAFAWEIRLQDEIGLEFRLEEPGTDGLRTAFQRDQTDLALACVEKEAERRLRNLRKDDKAAELVELRLPLGELWTIAPENVAALEVKLRKKCGGRFRIIEPGHDSARATLGRIVRGQGALELG